MNKIRLSRVLFISIMSMSLLYAFYVLFILYTYFVHESGHVIFGTISNLPYGQNSAFRISSWITPELIPFLKVPQQTSMIYGFRTGGFVLGGSLMIIIISSLISLLLVHRKKPIHAFFFFVIFILFEIIGNFLCGTDNPSGNPANFCHNNIFFGTIMLLIPVIYVLILFNLFITNEIIRNRLVAYLCKS